MPFVITPAERASFKRCRRQWDLGARTRQNLEPLQRPAIPDMDRALRAALAVYYYPGMWDWDRRVTLPLVLRGFERALTRQREEAGQATGQAAGQATAAAPSWQQQLEAGRSLLGRYFEWAPAVDGFSPVLIEAEYEVNVLDPARPAAGLVTADGAPIRYRGRIDLLAVDQHDAYWIVRHRLVDGDWPPTERLLQDEEALTACWAWEQFYLGMAIAGTVHNELRLNTPPARPGQPDQSGPGQPQRAAGHRGWLRRRQAAGGPPAVRQHEPSGGGRSIPQHRRMYAAAREPEHPEPVEQVVGEWFRRTWLRRGRTEVGAAGRQLGTDVAQMTSPGVPVYPSPSDANCPACAYLDPCLAMFAGQDAGPVLRSAYRQRPPERLEEGRLGGGAWGMGRGAAPPRFRSGQGR